MASNKTKTNIIELIADHISEKKFETKFMVTSNSNFPEECKLGVRIIRKDLETKYDEADYIIPQQVNAAINEGLNIIKVLSSDTDVFVLLCSFFNSLAWSPSEVYMASFSELPA